MKGKGKGKGFEEEYCELLEANEQLTLSIRKLICKSESSSKEYEGERIDEFIDGEKRREVEIPVLGIGGIGSGRESGGGVEKEISRLKKSIEANEGWFQSENQKNLKEIQNLGRALVEKTVQNENLRQELREFGEMGLWQSELDERAADIENKAKEIDDVLKEIKILHGVIENNENGFRKKLKEKNEKIKSLNRKFGDLEKSFLSKNSDIEAMMREFSKTEDNVRFQQTQLEITNLELQTRLHQS